jgi:hypothetical protein
MQPSYVNSMAALGHALALTPNPAPAAAGEGRKTLMTDQPIQLKNDHRITESQITDQR